MAKAHAARFDRRKFLNRVNHYGHSEFMLGLEKVGPLRDEKAKIAQDAKERLIDYVESVGNPAGLGELVRTVRDLVHEIAVCEDENGSATLYRMALDAKHALAAFEKGEE